MRGIGVGDLVACEYKKSIGILLEIIVYEKLMKNRFWIPWRYRIMWHDGIISEHDMGTLRRIAIYEMR